MGRVINRGAWSGVAGACAAACSCDACVGDAARRLSSPSRPSCEPVFDDEEDEGDEGGGLVAIDVPERAVAAVMEVVRRYREYPDGKGQPHRYANMQRGE